MILQYMTCVPSSLNNGLMANRHLISFLNCFSLKNFLEIYFHGPFELLEPKQACINLGSIFGQPGMEKRKCAYNHN